MLKRIFDLFAGIFAIFFLLPIIIVVATAVYIKLGNPVIFVQKRPGRNGVPFNMIKFRTMLNLKDSFGRDLPDAMRLTRFGKFLRSASLDELPEIWNIVKGDMSFVGPRPLLMEYLPLYTEDQARRHDLRPGITGWAQINGRNSLSWEEKFKLDVWYVDNRTFLIDMRIILLTMFRVLQRHGISADGSATMPPFKGKNQT